MGTRKKLLMDVSRYYYLAIRKTTLEQCAISIS